MLSTNVLIDISRIRKE